MQINLVIRYNLFLLVKWIQCPIASVLDKHAISYEVLGIQSENVISQVLIDSDYGISTTPYFQTKKSGVYMLPIGTSNK
jgi:hypothetical protein